MLTTEQFVGHLRSALNHLYDPDRLRHSPLVNLLGVAGRVDAHSRLQRVLIKTIEALEPESDAPSQSPAWWIYEVLFDRYVQRLSQQEVADHLGVCVRHMRRRQRAALEALAAQLWEEFDLETRSTEEAKAEAGITAMRPAEASPVVSEELAWLKDAPVGGAVSLTKVLPAVIDWTRPLAARDCVHLEVMPTDGLPRLAVHSVALSQILLSLLSVAIHRATGNHVSVSARPLQQALEIQLRSAKSPAGPRSFSEDDASSLDIAQQLTELCKGQLTLRDDDGAFSATLSLPTATERLVVEVIDDNADTLQLLERYTSNTRYHLVGERDPEEAVSLAQQLSPSIIVLDVMIPQVEGWEILARLRQHPLTKHIPVIVCTILAQQDLALSLGATSFVRKPVTRQAFLAALDQQAELLETESR